MSLLLCHCDCKHARGPHEVVGFFDVLRLQTQRDMTWRFYRSPSGYARSRSDSARRRFASRIRRLV
jgi:hypothetical protein